MDVDFVARGFRLPQYRGSLAISSATGRGTTWMADRLRQAVDEALCQSMDELATIVERLELQQQHDERLGFLGANTRAHMADLMAQLGELESDSLDALKHKFALHFAMRKLWLESVLRTLETSANCDITPTQLLSTCELLRLDVDHVGGSASSCASRVKEASEAHFTADKWATLAASKTSPAVNHHPLVRALSSMSETLEVVRAKILVCRECVSMIDGDHSASLSPEEIARVFASLKPDIDALNHLYQASVTSLAFYDSNSSVTGDSNFDMDDSTKSDELIGIEPSLADIPHGATVFGYTPFGVDDLDAPELVFEADIEQEACQGRLKPSAIDRNERIRLSKQKRADEQVASARKNDIVGMMCELKTAIDSRSKASTTVNQQTSEE
ncbi:hypothetical protein GGI21_002745 [Coemansia aciculifera]|nr:hypothetical protein GGI21_002745 [Coemansia aciculifera]